jgi:hypothetical protein
MNRPSSSNPRGMNPPKASEASESSASSSTVRAIARQALMARGRTLCETCGVECARSEAYEIWRGNRLFWVICKSCLRTPLELCDQPDGLHVERKGEAVTISPRKATAGQAPTSAEWGNE